MHAGAVLVHIEGLDAASRRDRRSHLLLLVLEGGRAASIGLSRDHWLWLLGLVTVTEAGKFVGLDIRGQDLHTLAIVDGTIWRLQALEVRLVEGGEIDVHPWVFLVYSKFLLYLQNQ